MSLTFENSFGTLPVFFHESVEPTPLKDASLLHCTNLRAHLGLSSLTDAQLCSWLNGESRLPGDQRISTRYAGHQFGVWAGQLGDGRAISLGEVLVSSDTGIERHEVQVKGSGRTPFSRFGDGKAVLRSCVREYLCAEAMDALGIPSTRSLALISGSGAVEREEVEPEALVARVFPTQIRFGHFEMAKHFDQKAELGALIDYTRTRFFPEHSTESMLEEVVNRTARMIALWQSVGFCHGVMNTDNMSILGLTLDYGPFGFMEDFNPDHVCNSSDREGRYAYSRQPSVGMENLERLLVCFTDLLPRERLISLLETYPERFETHFFSAFRAKLGFSEALSEDANLLKRLFLMLEEHKIDFTSFFRGLSRYEVGQVDSLDEFFGSYPALRHEGSRVREWLRDYDQRLALEGSVDSTRRRLMLARNPKFVLKNPIAGAVIADPRLLNEAYSVIRSPFEEHPELDAHPEFKIWSRPLPDALKNQILSCSS